MKRRHTNKRNFKKFILFTLTVCLTFALFTVNSSAQTVTGLIDTLKSYSAEFAKSENIRYSYDKEASLLTMYAILTADNGIEYIADTAYVDVDRDGNWKVRTEDIIPDPLSDEEARILTDKRLWLYKADKYDNTYLLDFTQTPIKDTSGTEWFPLLDEFSTTSKFTAYLKTIFTNSLANDYITNTSIRIFGNELYDIGGKVSMYSFHYEDYLLEKTFESDNGDWYFYKVTVPMDNEIGNLTFEIGLYFTEDGWRVCYDGFGKTSEIASFVKAEKRIDLEDDSNPSTCDISLIYPLISILAFSGILFVFQKKK